MRTEGRARPAVLVGAWLAVASCGDDGSPPPAAESSTGGTTAALTTSTNTAAGTTAEASTSAATTAADGTGSTSAGSSDSGSGTTGAAACTKNVVLMGYWPPTNEMLRPWSTNPEQNPDGWIGENWEGYGYDVYSFFPEFPPDGDPSNDSIGDDGAVGSPRFDLRVDYQATSADFWRIVDQYQPVILVTTSRGGGIGWEIEAIEGGHGDGNPGSPAFDWSSDQHGRVEYPIEGTVDSRSWDAITTHRQANTLSTQLPVDAIVDATSLLELTSVEVDETGTSGNFLSGFLGLHGLYYNEQNPHNVAAGHIHVANGLPVDTASVLIDITLHAVLMAHPVDSVECPPRGR